MSQVLRVRDTSVILSLLCIVDEALNEESPFPLLPQNSLIVCFKKSLYILLILKLENEF